MTGKRCSCLVCAVLLVAWSYILVNNATHGNTALAVIAEIVYLAIIAGCIWAHSQWKEQRDLRIEQEAREKQRQRDEEYVRSGMAAIDLMPGIEFEQYVAAKLRQDGWLVSLTSVSGDYGVDVIAKKEGRSVAVQCKRQGKPVGIQAVQEVVTGAKHYECMSSAVVSNREFTPAAKQLAITHNRLLVARSVLPNLGGLTRGQVPGIQPGRPMTNNKRPIVCSHCAARLTMPADSTGKQFKCAKCGERTTTELGAALAGNATAGHSDHVRSDGSGELKILVKPRPNRQQAAPFEPGLPLSPLGQQPLSPLSQQNAVRAAKQYLDMTAYSHDGLIKQLEYEHYSAEGATYAADNVNADWNQQAARAAKRYLDVIAYSHDGLVSQLEDEGYSTEDATYAADSLNADWNQQAARAAKRYLDVIAYSHDGLVSQLEDEGYSTEDATYAADSLNADWNQQAARAAKEYLAVSAYSRTSLIDQLVHGGVHLSAGGVWGNRRRALGQTRQSCCGDSLFSAKRRQFTGSR